MTCNRAEVDNGAFGIGQLLRETPGQHQGRIEVRVVHGLPFIQIAVPFVVVPVLTALEILNLNLARAAAACGATLRVTFMRVTLPGIMPAMASGALFAFAASFDDVVIALLIAGPATQVAQELADRSLAH